MEISTRKIDLPVEKARSPARCWKRCRIGSALRKAARNTSAKARMPFGASFAQEKLVGCIALRQTSPHAAEIYVMGVRREMHRQGVGRALFAALRGCARAADFRFLQVKTVAQDVYPKYDSTRSFYEACGFCELEVFPTLWDEGNPCSVMVLSLC